MLRTGTTAWKKFSTCCTSRSAPIPLGSTGTVTCSLRLDYEAHGPIGPIAFKQVLIFSWRWNMMETTYWHVLLDVSQRLISWGHGDEKIGMRGISGSDFIRFPAGLHDFGLNLGLSNVEHHTKGSSRFTSGFCWSLNLTIVHYFSELIFLLLTHYNATLTMPTISPQAVSEDAWALAWQLLVVCHRCAVGPSSRYNISSITTAGYQTISVGGAALWWTNQWSGFGCSIKHGGPVPQRTSEESTGGSVGVVNG